MHGRSLARFGGESKVQMSQDLCLFFVENSRIKETAGETAGEKKTCGAPRRNAQTSKIAKAGAARHGAPGLHHDE